MGALAPDQIRSGHTFGRRGDGIRNNAGEPERALWARRGHEPDRCGRWRRLRHRHREAAMAMMPADGLVVVVICGAVKDRTDLRAATGRRDVDIVQAMQRSREQVDNRDQHRQQPAPGARPA